MSFTHAQDTIARGPGRFARVTLAAVLAAGLMLPSMASLMSPAEAYAADGTVKVTNITDNETQWHAWQVFTADIGDDDYAQHIAWNTAVKSTVLTFLDANGYPAWLASKGHTSTATIGDYTATDRTAHDDPQNAAEFISGMIDVDSLDDTDFGVITRQYVIYNTGDDDADAAANAKVNKDDYYSKIGSTFAARLARTLANAGISPTDLTAVSGENAQTLTAPEGFYLITTVPSTVGTDEAGSAPIWMPLGGSTTEIQEKAALISMNKKVSTDQASSGQGVATVVWGKAADANTDQDVWFRLNGTLPANIHSFPVYHYKFTDTLGAGTHLASDNTSSVKVVVYPTAAAMEADTTSASFGTGGVDITSNAQTTIEYVDDVLTVDIADLLLVDLDSTTEGVQTVDKNSVVAVYYKAHVDEGKTWATTAGDPATSAQTVNDADVVYGDGASAVGNENSAKLTYSKDPSEFKSGSTTELIDVDTTSAQASLYSYQLELHKYDKSNGQPLANAGFTVKVADSSTDVPSRGLYVQADGSLGANPFEFFTDADGVLKVAGVDEGVYTIHENTAPPVVDQYGSTTRSRYELPEADITLTITSALNQDTGALTSLGASVSGGETASVNDSDMVTRLGYYDLAATTHHKAAAATVDGSTNPNNDAINKTTGTIVMMTVDDRAILMPITGLEGYMPWIVLALGLIAVGTAGGVTIQRHRAKGRVDED